MTSQAMQETPVWESIKRWGSLASAIAITAALVSGALGAIPFVTNTGLDARVIPIEDKIDHVEDQMDIFLKVFHDYRIDDAEQELREIDRSILEIQSRMKSGEAGKDTQMLLRNLQDGKRDQERKINRLIRERDTK